MLANRRVKVTAALAVGLLVQSAPMAWSQCGSFPQAPFPMQEGMSVLTCFGGFTNPQDQFSPLVGDGFVMAVVDTRDPACAGAQLGQNWCAPMFHNEFPITSDSWTAAVHSSVAGGGAQNLGQLFGVTHDDRTPPNIFVSATTVYGDFTGDPYQFGFAGAGGVYKIDGSTGAISAFATLPNASGASLGNLVFDAATQRVYVTNFDDGLIYSVPVGAGSTFTYDHGVSGRPAESLAPIADDPTQQFTQLGRRVWGVHVWEGRLYYSVYWEDQGRPSATEANEVWSVALNTGGGNPFVGGSAQLEVSVPVFQGNHSNPVSSIAFSSTGNMLLAERVKNADYGFPFSDAHQARVLEYELNAGVWVPSGNDFFIGNFSTNTNSSGGADYDCETSVNCGAVGQPIENVWATGDALNLQAGQAIYGLQRTPPSGNVFGSVPLTSYWVDLDGVLTTFNKTQTGDIEVFCRAKACMSVTDEHVTCNPDDPSKVTFSANITNNSGVDAEWVVFTAQSPAGQLMVTANMQQISIADGSTASVSVTLMGINGLTDLTGEELCFSITLLDETLEACCSTEVCVTPDCDCFQIVTSELKCVDGDPWKFTWTFEFVNLTGDVVEHAYFFPPSGLVIDTPEAVDNYLSFDPGLNPGQSSGPITVTLCFDMQDVPPAPGTVICFPITIHDQFLFQCCAGEHCVEVPECMGGGEFGGCCLCDGTCVEMTEEECAPIGFYLGDGIACGTPGVICQDAFGACCFTDFCIDNIWVCECEASGGVFLGVGSNCQQCAIVIKVGACCLPDGTCSVITADECELLAGVYLGDGSTCDACGQQMGVCCYTDFCNPALTQAECESTGGLYLPPPSTCADCPVPLVGDCNGDGKVDSIDLNDLLANFGGTSEWADLNDDGVVNSIDLNILLANFGMGVD